jgi:hypothetical protein
MHAGIFVVGPNPLERVERTKLPYGTPDWAGIGGRYTGRLIPLPGATTGVAHGDTLTPIEAWMATHSPGFVRPGAAQGAGVDHIARRELDLEATEGPPYVLDADDHLHDAGYTTEEQAFVLVARMARQFGTDPGNPPSAATLQAIIDKGEAWDRRWRELIAAADPDALITAVDAHF